MTDAVQWELYLWEEDKTLDEVAVRQLESELGVSFPDPYLRVLTRHQGKYPAPNGITVGRGETAAGCLFHFTEDSYNNAYSVRTQLRSIEEFAPPLLVPFIDSNGNVFCFDFRSSRDQPKIVFLWHEVSIEDAIIPIAESFSDFLGKLHD